MIDGGTNSPETDVVAELAEEDVLEVPSGWAPRTGTHLTRNLMVGHALGKGVQVGNGSVTCSSFAFSHLHLQWRWWLAGTCLIKPIPASNADIAWSLLVPANWCRFAPKICA